MIQYTGTSSRSNYNDERTRYHLGSAWRSFCSKLPCSFALSNLLRDLGVESRPSSSSVFFFLLCCFCFDLSIFIFVFLYSERTEFYTLHVCTDTRVLYLCSIPMGFYDLRRPRNKSKQHLSGRHGATKPPRWAAAVAAAGYLQLIRSYFPSRELSRGHGECQ